MIQPGVFAMHPRNERAPEIPSKFSGGWAGWNWFVGYH